MLQLKINPSLPSRSWLASPHMTSTRGRARWRTASWWPRCSRSISSGIMSPSSSTAECRPTPGESKHWPGGGNWANTWSGILLREAPEQNLENMESNSEVCLHWFHWYFLDYILDEWFNIELKFLQSSHILSLTIKGCVCLSVSLWVSHIISSFLI